MKAIILAGGLGTRLKSIVPNFPKPLAPVADRPFLAYQLDFLSHQKITEVYFSTGYKGEMIQSEFGTTYKNLSLHYLQEPAPLGTGGAIRYCLSHIPGDHDNPFLILNGDTYFDFSVDQLLSFHQQYHFDCSLALYEVEKADRYGTLSLDGPKITSFHEKNARLSNIINAGVYLISSSIVKKLASIPLENFSWEKEVLEKFSEHHLTLGGLLFPANFIDIGIPEDYQKAQTLLPEWNKKNIL